MKEILQSAEKSIFENKQSLEAIIILKNLVNLGNKSLYLEWEKSNFNVNHKFCYKAKRSCYKLSILEICIMENHENIRNILIKDKFSYEKTLIIRLAIYQGNLKAIKFVLEDNPENLDTLINYSTFALHTACLVGNLDIVRYLAMSGSRINGTLKSGATPLHIACFEENFKIIQYLIANGGRINAITISGKTPLHIVSIKGRTDLVKYLLDHGSKINWKSSNGNTALHYAAFAKSERTVKYLLHRTAQTNCKNNSGETPLHYMMHSKENIERELRIMKKLLVHGTRINELTYSLKTALHYAIILRRSIEIIRFLLKKGAKVNYITSDYKTALDYANQYQSSETIEYLIENRGLTFQQMNDNKKMKNILLKESISIQMCIRDSEKVSVVDETTL